MTLLKHRRLSLDFTTREVGVLSGLTQTAISLIENRRLNPRPDELAAIARVLRVSAPVMLLEEVKLSPSQEAALLPERVTA